MSSHTDPETLRRLYHDEGLTLAEIGERFDRDRATIGHHFEKHGIERRGIGGGPKDAAYKDAETLRRLHWDEGLSTVEMGERLGKDRSTLEYWFEKHGIETRSRGEALRHHYRTNVDFHTDHHGYETIRVQEYGDTERFRHHRLLYYATHGVSLSEMRGRDVHHHNNCSYDNRPVNLELLSKSDHSRLHAVERWGGE